MADVKLYSKDWRLRHTYGITLEEWGEMFRSQEGKCFICGKAPNILHVDHKHQPKEKQIRKKKESHKIRPYVRGLLCWQCNAAIAKFRDDPIRLRSAANYLENPPARLILKETNVDLL